MFTWLVTHKSAILWLHDGQFVITKSDDMVLTVWQSISHDGACMTVDSIDDESYTFFAMGESFSKTSFAHKKVWDVFNIECSMKMGDPLDGHLVSGHIDTTATISEICRWDDDALQLYIKYDQMFDRLVVPKGSIAINGVSLTVVDVTPGWCSVWLIPLTQQETNLWALGIDDIVNIEFDMLAKYAVWRGRGDQ